MTSAKKIGIALAVVLVVAVVLLLVTLLKNSFGITVPFTRTRALPLDVNIEQLSETITALFGPPSDTRR